MRPFDAVFLALAAGLFLERPKHWWLVALAPLVALAASSVPLEQFERPIAALVACLLAPRYAPATPQRCAHRFSANSSESQTATSVVAVHAS